MFEIHVQMAFSAAHNLREYRGKCENLHGHNWQVEAVFGMENLGKDGMVIDFKIARRLLRNVLSYFDHAYINKKPYFRKVNPTSEHIAQFIYRQLAEKIRRKNFSLLRVSVWETPGSRAVYYE